MSIPQFLMLQILGSQMSEGTVSQAQLFRGREDKKKFGAINSLGGQGPKLRWTADLQIGSNE